MRESIALLERGKDENLNSQARMAPEALDGHFSEERHRLYRMLRRKAVVAPDRSLEVSGPWKRNLYDRSLHDRKRLR
jgi:hypothetical protein